MLKSVLKYCHELFASKTAREGHMNMKFFFTLKNYATKWPNG